MEERIKKLELEIQILKTLLGWESIYTPTAGTFIELDIEDNKERSYKLTLEEEDIL